MSQFPGPSQEEKGTKEIGPLSSPKADSVPKSSGEANSSPKRIPFLNPRNVSSLTSKSINSCPKGISSDLNCRSRFVTFRKRKAHSNSGPIFSSVVVPPADDDNDALSGGLWDDVRSHDSTYFNTKSESGVKNKSDHAPPQDNLPSAEAGEACKLVESLTIQPAAKEGAMVGKVGQLSPSLASASTPVPTIKFADGEDLSPVAVNERDCLTPSTEGLDKHSVLFEPRTLLTEKSPNTSSFAPSLMGRTSKEETGSGPQVTQRNNGKKNLVSIRALGGSPQGAVVPSSIICDNRTSCPDTSPAWDIFERLSGNNQEPDNESLSDDCSDGSNSVEFFLRAPSEIVAEKLYHRGGNKPAKQLISKPSFSKLHAKDRETNSLPRPKLYL